MNKDTEATVLLALGVIVGRLTLAGGYQSYVKTGLFWPLLGSSAVLVAIGAATLWQSYRGQLDAGPTRQGDVEVHGTDLPDDHDDHTTRVGLLLLCPIVVLLLVAPASLGSFSADRARPNQTVEAAIDTSLPPIPEPVDGAVELPLGGIITYALFPDRGEDLAGVPLRATGFVTPIEDADDRYLLTRFTMGCCAADAVPNQVLVTGAGEVPPPDTWVEVEAEWTGELERLDVVELPVLAMTSQRVVDEPAQPYDY